ncbi:polyprotein [Tunisian sheep-like pestivirus]|uniref:Genome polyprotein n=1 Tax=Tunisian sheep-like pestivirus TaxID=3071305 RepID=A0A8G1H4Y3_9FLAV|nr:polyprotein [Tunisian small ruminant pestivirus]QZA87341.1 polyprotein [Tunisian small ruminant pestivirus]
MELNHFELLYKTSKQKPLGVVEPVYNKAGEPLFGEASEIHPQSTLKLPHDRGRAEIRTKLKSLPRKGDCRSGNNQGPVSGVYIKPGPVFYQDYAGPVYHRAPLEMFAETQFCEVTKRLGRVTGSDGKLYHIYVCIDGCIMLKLVSKSESKVLKWVRNITDCPLWVASCSDEGASGCKAKKPDRISKGALKIAPKEHEKDSKTKPPDATIVVDGIKYQVKKKGKVKGKNTQDGLYHNKNKPPESRKKLEKALLAWAIVAMLLLQPVLAENITQWNLSDNGTSGIQHAMYQRGINRSLHGIWPERICTGVPTHLATDAELKGIQGMMDASERTNYTCCRLQRHEWNKHGWCNWYNIDPWIWLMNKTQANLTQGPPEKECAVTCRYDKHSDTNIVTQARDRPTTLTGCKKGKMFSFAGTIIEGPCNFNVSVEDILYGENECGNLFQDTALYVVDGVTNTMESARQGAAKLTSWLGKQLGIMGKKLEHKSKTWFGANAQSPYCNVTRKIGYIWYTNNCTPACLPKNTKIIGPGKFDTNAEDGKILHEMGGHISEFLLLSLVILSDFAPETASTLYLVLHFTIPQTHNEPEGCDLNQLNLTVGLRTEEVVPSSVWNLGKYVCVRPDWWPYETTVVLLFEEVGQVIKLVLRAIRDLTRVWNSASTTAFLICLVKVIRGQVIQGVIWLLLVTGAQGQLSCKADHRYAMSSTKNIGPLGAMNLTTTWQDYREGLQLDDGTTRAVCRRGHFLVRTHCGLGLRYLATLHVRALPTSVTFELLYSGLNQKIVEMDDNFEYGLCPCNAKPVVKGKFNTTLLNGSAFNLVCPIGWVGVIECTTVSETTLKTEVVRTFVRKRPFPYRDHCVTTTIVGEDLHHCTLGGNWTCIKGQQVNYSGGQLKECKWCGYTFKAPDGLPHYPIGKCILSNETGYRYVDDTTCNRGGVVIDRTGGLQCIIGKTTVNVFAVDDRLGPMPCKPKDVTPSEGPVSKTACTFNYTKTLKNKYYEPRDSYFQQYMLKGEYQYWFDLDVTDHHTDYFAEFVVLVVVALLGGRYVLWLMVTYIVLTEQFASAIQLGQGEVVLIGNLITHEDIEVVVYFLLLYLVVRDEPIKRWVLLLFHALTNNPVKTITVGLLMVSGTVRGEESGAVQQPGLDLQFILIVIVVIMMLVARRDPTTIPLIIAVVAMRTTGLASGLGTDLAIAVTATTLLAWTFVSDYYKYKSWLQLAISMVSGIFLIRALKGVAETEVHIPELPSYRPLFFILIYLVSTAVVTRWNLDIAGSLLQFVPTLLTALTIWADIITLVLVLPTYELTKLYYLKGLKTETERNWLGKSNYKRVNDVYEIDQTNEGVYLFPSRQKTDITTGGVLPLVKAILISCISSKWQFVYLLYLIIETSYYLHRKVIEEIAGGTNLISRFIAALIEANWALDDQEVKGLKKFFVLSSRVRNLIIKHKVRNDSVARWFSDEEIYGMPKLVSLVKIATLSRNKHCILCTVCEDRNWRGENCPKCGRFGPPITCGMTLADFEERHYKRIFIREDQSDGPDREECKGYLQYRARGQLFLRNLPVLATKVKLLLVGNLGAEIGDLEHLGWVLRGPAVCKKVTEHEKCATSIMDKLTAFFGIMPRGTTPRAPVRFPTSLLKIRRGLETGWAYTHQGGISSVDHVTCGKDLLVCDSMGRTRVVCQSNNKMTDETEYGVKTDSGCPEGARCYVFNPEAVNISGTKGAMVHLQKTGGEFTCVTASGTPAFFDLKNLKGWSGLPIFESSSGRVVGRVKVGKNEESKPTKLMSGIQTVSKSTTDLTEMVKKITAMNRGEFKQITLATGAGKTTELPRCVIEEIGRHKRVLVLIPLRAAAESVYQYMRQKHPSIAFNLRIGEMKEGDMATGITYASYGYFCQMPQPKLRSAMVEYSYIFLDEYHCATPEQLAIIGKIHRFSENLRVVAMTATPAGTVTTTGQKHPIEEFIAPEVMKGEDLGSEYLDIAGLKIPVEEMKGNMLVFVPTRNMAVETAKKLKTKGYNSGYYYSGEDPSNLRVVTSQSPYVVVATNAIESGVTLPDLDVVVDTGLKCEKRIRLSSKMPFIVTGLKRMAVTIGEQAQRRGRVGRVKPGRYYRSQETAVGSKDYHYDLLQAQRYGIEDGINITKSFREMNYDWSLYEEDSLMITQLEILNNLLISEELPIAVKNIMARTDHPEPIQLAYNSYEVQVPVLFPKIRNGEVTDSYDNYTFLNARKLGDDVPAYVYATEDEDLAVELLGMDWPDPGNQGTAETGRALKQVVGLSTAENALLVALFGYVGYQALSKRHIPIVTDIYSIEDQRLEDTTPQQFAPNAIRTEGRETELRELSQGDLQRCLDAFSNYANQGVQFMKAQAERVQEAPIYRESVNTLMDYVNKFLEALSDNKDDIIRYGLWGTHTALYKSIGARLGYETAFATLVIKWLAFGGETISDHIKQAATDLVVYYIINRPQFPGDTETQQEGRKFVASLLVSALATYTYKSWNYSNLSKIVEPALACLPYASQALKLFAPTRLESVVILSTAIYKTYLAIRRGKSEGLLGTGVSAAMEIMSQNPVSVGIAVMLGVGAVAAHNAIEASEQKRTLLMKVFVKNFLDQAATDELVKESPEKIIMALFEAVQTVGNPLRLIYHLYGVFYKGWEAKEVAERTAGRNLFTLIMFEAVELLGVDSEGKMRNLSSNYILDLLHKFQDSIKTTVKRVVNSWAPAPFSCDWSPTDKRIGLPHNNYLRVETRCPCGYRMKALKNCAGELRLLEEEGSVLCRNKFGRGLQNYRVTKYYDDDLKEVKPILKMEGQVELYYKGVTIKLDFDNGKTILATDKWEVDHATLARALKKHTGAGYQGAHLGEKPNHKNLIERDCATITRSKVYFSRMKKGCAFTYDMSMHNLTRLIELVHKNNMEERDIPAVTVTTWLAYTFVNEDIGTIRPVFGEKVKEDRQDEVNLQPTVAIDASDTEITVVGQAEVMTTGETPVTYHSSIPDGQDQTVLKLGTGVGQYPGPNQQKLSLHEAIQHKDRRPTVLILGSEKAMSNRVKTAKNVKVYKGKDPLEVRDMMRKGKILVVALAKVDSDLLKYVDYKGTFLARETLEALSMGKPKAKEITKAEVRRLMHLEEQTEELPDWFAAEEPIFLEASIKQERYHLVGDILGIKEKAKQLGATDSTKIVKEVGAKVYSMKLSNWVIQEEKGQNNLTPLFEEALLQCPPGGQVKTAHMVSAYQLAQGNWMPISCQVFLGTVPAKRVKTHPYESYVRLRELMEEYKMKTLCGGHSLGNHNKWIIGKIKHQGNLRTKHILNPGKVAEQLQREGHRHNVYNKVIGSTMAATGIRLERLPVVRAQTDTANFHQAIRDKIDKSENPQTPGLHSELMEIFNALKRPELASTYDAVEWEELERGINRKGASGFFEHKNIGEVLASEKSKVEELIDNLKRGRNIRYYETAIPKNEKRDVNDDWDAGDFVDEKKPRVIQYPEAKTRLAITKVMYKWVKQKPIVIPGYEGKTPLFQIFDKVKKEWDQFHNPVAVSFDTKAWDTQVTSRDLELIRDIQKYYFKKKWHKFIDTLTMHMTEVPVISADGEVYIRKGQRGSGQPDTSAGNSMLNVLTMIYAFCKATGVPYKSFERVAKIHVCGDDGFLITERALGEKFASKGVQILHEAGKPQKITEGDRMKVAYQFEDIEFCSHTPVQVRWSDNKSSYMPGRNTSTILAKMATRLDSSGERGTTAYEKAVAFSFLLMYSWNPLVRRICLLVLSSEPQVKPGRTTTYYFEGDPISAYKEVIGHNLHDLKRTGFEKLAKLNLSMTTLGIWTRHTSKRLLQDCISVGSREGNWLVNADRLVSEKTGNMYVPGEGHTMQGKHYEELMLQRMRPSNFEGTERYNLGPIVNIVLRRLKVLMMTLMGRGA